MKKTQAGMTLVELMIATAMIGIGVIVAAGAFTSIQRAIQSSKYRTLAANIAQEKMQIITQKPYYDVLVTTLPATRTDVSPTVYYDPYYFVPETLSEGGINYTRYTNVQVVQEIDGVITPLDPFTPDTGIRQITETVVWTTDTGQKSLAINDILNNPNTAMASTWLRGTVTNIATSVGIVGATVNAAENIGWRDTTSTAGVYGINLTPGTYNFVASAAGYFPNIIQQSVAFNNVTPLNFQLTAIASGTINGTAWIDNHLVISQIVASTGPANSIEYVDLYNPTTSPMNIGSNASYTTPNVWPVVFDNNGNNFGRQLVYISTFIPSYGYYLISNTGDGGGASASIFCSTFTILGTNVQPDACWRYVGTSELPDNHTLQCSDVSGGNSCVAAQNASGFGIGSNGGVAWAGLGGTVKYDAIGWSGNGTTPNSYENAPAVTSSGNGLAAGEAFVRRLDTTSAVSNTLGNAYDADNNSQDFLDRVSIPWVPRNHTSILIPETGTPATGAHVSVTDGLSGTSTTTLTGSPPFAQYTIPGVATGTWIVFIDSNSASAEIDTVTVSGNATTSIPNNITCPLWPTAGVYAVSLTTNGTVGIINGKVTDASNAPIAGGITVKAGAASAVTSANGNYLLRLSTGIYDIVANPGNANSSYETQTQPGINVSLGDVSASVNFQLSLGGRISGWVSRDETNPLPGVAVVALDAFGAAHDTEASGNDGKFTLINLTTGSYTVQPVLDSKEISSPISNAAVVTAGATVSVGTFTVIGALGQVQGTVKAGGQLIKSGVLIVVSTSSINLPPPALSSNTLVSNAYYADSSNETGTYSVDVRGSTSTVYNVEALYMHLNNQTPVISSATCSNVTVTAGQPITGATKSCLNFSW